MTSIMTKKVMMINTIVYQKSTKLISCSLPLISPFKIEEANNKILNLLIHLQILKVINDNSVKQFSTYHLSIS